jgi:tetratricopeptide (TPR) repeat protein
VILPLLALAAAQISIDPLAPAAPDPAVEGRLRACTALIRTAPQQALDTANAWLSARGGLPARQCAGLAYVALQQWAAAATVYEQAARDAEAAQNAARADFWVQAGNAWLAAGEGPRALRALDAALAAPDLSQELRGGAHLDRARAQVALGHADVARQDIDRALQLVPADPLAWYLSAALARREGNAARAGTDLARARDLAPDNADILLLAGTIAGQAGNMEEAERLYRRVVQLAPDSESGREARESLATMREVEVPAPAAASAAPPPPQSR